MSSFKIVVPTRTIAGGFASKFESDPYNVKLYGILTPDQYTQVVEALNQKLKRARPNVIDGALLVTGPLILPLAVWGLRHKHQTNKRKRLLQKAISEFHTQYPHLYMRWNVHTSPHCLTIERRPQQNDQQQQHEVQAQLVGDDFQTPVHVTSIPPTIPTEQAIVVQQNSHNNVPPAAAATEPHAVV